MARYVGPSCRLCRAEGRKLFLKGERCSSAKCAINKKRNAPGKDSRSKQRKFTDYCLQLREKQKLKRIYGMLENQFKIFFNKADKKSGKTGDNLIVLLESRLDNIVYRMRFASSRNQARQLVSHGHINVNGRRVNIPSYIVKAGDVIEVNKSSLKIELFKANLSKIESLGSFPWVEVDVEGLKGKVLALPERAEITDLADIKENLVVELYSR